MNEDVKYIRYVDGAFQAELKQPSTEANIDYSEVCKENNRTLNAVNDGIFMVHNKDHEMLMFGAVVQGKWSRPYKVQLKSIIAMKYIKLILPIEVEEQ